MKTSANNEKTLNQKNLTVDRSQDGCVPELLLREQLVLHVGGDVDEVLLPDPLPVADQHLVLLSAPGLVLVLVASDRVCRVLQIDQLLLPVVGGGGSDVGGGGLDELVVGGADEVVLADADAGEVDHGGAERHGEAAGKIVL